MEQVLLANCSTMRTLRVVLFPVIGSRLIVPWFLIQETSIMDPTASWCPTGEYNVHSLPCWCMYSTDYLYCLCLASQHTTQGCLSNEFFSQYKYFDFWADFQPQGLSSIVYYSTFYIMCKWCCRHHPWSAPRQTFSVSPGKNYVVKIFFKLLNLPSGKPYTNVELMLALTVNGNEHQIKYNWILVKNY